jgi:hypothetical protein
MFDHSSSDETPFAVDFSSLDDLLDAGADAVPTLVAWVERTADGVECTIAPEDVASEFDRMSQWISAGRGSFVPLSEMC